MDFANHVGSGQREQVVVTAADRGPVGKALAAVIGLLEPVALHHGAHRAVENDDAFRPAVRLQLREAFCSVRSHDA